MTATTIRIIVALALGAGLFVFAFFAPRASGAERDRAVPHEITLVFPGADLDHVSRSFFTLSGPYADRSACERAKRRLVVMVKGARLVCHRVEPGRVR